MYRRPPGYRGHVCTQAIYIRLDVSIPNQNTNRQKTFIRTNLVDSYIFLLIKSSIHLRIGFTFHLVYMEKITLHINYQFIYSPFILVHSPYPRLYLYKHYTKNLYYLSCNFALHFNLIFMHPFSNATSFSFQLCRQILKYNASNEKYWKAFQLGYCIFMMFYFKLKTVFQILNFVNAVIWYAFSLKK